MPFFTLTPKTLAGPGYVLLNVVRAMNIVGLLAVITSSIVMVVKTVMSSQLYFFDGLSHMITAFICGMFLTDLQRPPLPNISTSLSDHLGNSTLSHILPHALASSQPNPWLCHTRPRHAWYWCQHSWKPQQSLCKQRGPWVEYLALGRCLRNCSIRIGLGQYLSRKLSRNPLEFSICKG